MKHKYQNTRAYRSIRLLALPIATAMLFANTSLNASEYSWKAAARDTKIVSTNSPEDQQSGLVRFNPETMEAPSFPNGMQELMKFLEENLKYPEKAIKKKIEGRVIVRFEVDTDGNIKNPEIIHSTHHLLRKEALRIIKAMPKWTPGYYKDSKVRVRTTFNLPMTFRLE